MAKNLLRARVLLADDHAANAQLLRGLLEMEFEVVGAVQNGYALVGAAESLSPDVIVSDISMPGLDGIEAAKRILYRNPAARIVFVTMHDEPEMVKRSLAIGALGYVLKMVAGEELVPAVRAALNGGRHISALHPPHSEQDHTQIS
ncbi:MAG: response regulator transcription factor [Burkholderiales bacterium]